MSDYRYVVKGEQIKPVEFNSKKEAEKFAEKLREAGVREVIVEEEKELTYPVSEGVKVINGETIYKTPTWWMAALLTERFNRREVAVYRWKKKKDRKEWSRK
jgi:uroporphyrinogen-III synthase